MARAGERRFTDEVRQEVARLPLVGVAASASELSALFRLAGSVTLTSSGLELTVSTQSGAVARRAYALCMHTFNVRAEVLVRAPGGVRASSTYYIQLGSHSTSVGRQLGILTERDRIAEPVPRWVIDQDPLAWIRGATLACASFSRPGGQAHVEFRVSSEPIGRQIQDVLQERLAYKASLTSSRDGTVRVIMKSGQTIGDLLVLIGAQQAFLTWDERRLRRQLRGEANRLANADAANLRRSIDASSRQVHDVEAAIARVGWQGLDDELRDIALARLANPAASLSELGELVEPRVGKSTVRRRLQRLANVGAATDEQT